MKNALCLGTFDGVHKGHKAVLDIPEGYRKIAVTFKEPPKNVITGVKELILTETDKYRVLKVCGVDELVSLDFNEVKDISALAFLNMLKEKYNPALICCGFNYRFGRSGLGDTDLLSKFCLENGILFSCTEPVREGDTLISSTYVRELLKKGEPELANKVLCEPFSFEAEVIDGNHLGRTIGFPTVNQKYPEELVKLRFGVYKTKILYKNAEYYGITNIGTKPTVGSDCVLSETYIKDFSGDLYGEILRIIPIKFLRDEVKFSSLEELKKQIIKDLNY